MSSRVSRSFHSALFISFILAFTSPAYAADLVGEAKLLGTTFRFPLPGLWESADVRILEGGSYDWLFIRRDRPDDYSLIMVLLNATPDQRPSGCSFPDPTGPELPRQDGDVFIRHCGMSGLQSHRRIQISTYTKCGREKPCLLEALITFPVASKNLRIYEDTARRFIAYMKGISLPAPSIPG